MSKKSQITAFIILGIILLVTGGIVVYIRTNSIDLGRDPIVGVEIPAERDAIIAYIKDCMNEGSGPIIDELSRQGGTLNRSSYDFTTYPSIYYTESEPYFDPITNLTATDLIANYYRINYTYFCKYQGFRGCVNTLITRSRMQKELNSAIRERIESCVNLDQFRDKGFEVTEGAREVSTSITSEEVNVKLEFPITISQNDVVIEITEIQTLVKSNLGELYDAAVNITNNEILHGYFDEDEFMRITGGEIQIEKHKPFPDTIYSLKKYNKRTRKESEFNFAIQGIDTVSLIGYNSLPQEQHPYCDISGGNCYANVDPIDCGLVGGTTSEDPNCIRPSIYTDGCTDCRSCGNHSHGESWCVYDSIVGRGYDYVGSRHYKQTCIDGRIYSTECRDYRDEICTEDLSTDPTTAVCRVNRWQDCAEQTNQNSCDDGTKRDCKWSSWLVEGTNPSYNLQRTERGCHPEVPPGFRFWTGQSEGVCNVANEWRKCDGFSCPRVWTETVMQYCYFQGDCGEYRNIADRVAGSVPTMERPRDYIYLDGGWPERADSPDNSLQLPLNERGQALLDGREFDNPEGEYEAILDAAIDWVEDVSSWEVCDFCNCVFGVPVGDCIFDERIFAAQICRPWEAPLSGRDCDKCEEDSTKPCTEYRCKSLGAKCDFGMDDSGRGFCVDDMDEDTIPLTIDGYVPLFDNYSVVEDNFLGIEGIRVCNGDTCDDDDLGEDGLQPFSSFRIMFNLSKEAQCKISPFPGLNFGQIPSFGASRPFSKTYTAEINVYSLHDIEELILQMTDLTTILTLADLEEMETKIETLATKTKNLADSMGTDTGQIDWALSIFQDEIMPRAREMREDAGEALDGLMIQMVMKNALNFVRCRDKAGNENEFDFFIKYTVAEDQTPPRILNISPRNSSYVTDPFNFTVSLNEPSICKYSIDSDKNYDAMPNIMDCATSWLDSRFGVYDCMTNVDYTGSDVEVYVKCADQPPSTRKYNLHLVESTTINITNADYSDMIYVESPNTINVTNTRVLKNNNTRIGVWTDTVRLKMLQGEASECKFAESPMKFEDMVNPIPCSAYGDDHLCTANLVGIPGDHSYYIACRDLNATIPNINGESYVFEFSNILG